MVFSSPLKILEFLSDQRHHIKQSGIAFQMTPTLLLPTLPCQQFKRSTTFLGITQETPNRENTKFHRSWAPEQFNNKWLIDSPAKRQWQHQSMIITPLSWRLSVVRILSRAAVQTKKATFDGTQLFQTVLQGNKGWVGECNTWYNDFTSNSFLEVGCQQMELAEARLTGMEYRSSIKEVINSIHLPILNKSYELNVPMLNWIRQMMLVYRRSLGKSSNSV